MKVLSIFSLIFLVAQISLAFAELDAGQCNPDECLLQGECQCYEICTGNHWVRHECNGNSSTGDLFWNPDANSIHGGTCDYFENLSPTLQEKYRQDVTCIPLCEWYQKPQDDCSPRYTYIEPFNNQTTAGRSQDLECPQPPPNSGLEPLYWNQAELSCDKKSRVNSKDGSPCP